MLKHITLADYMKEYAFSRLRELNTDIEPHQEAIIQSWIPFESIHFYTIERMSLGGFMLSFACRINMDAMLNNRGDSALDLFFAMDRVDFIETKGGRETISLYKYRKTTDYPIDPKFIDLILKADFLSPLDDEDREVLWDGNYLTVVFIARE